MASILQVIHFYDLLQELPSRRYISNVYRISKIFQMISGRTEVPLMGLSFAVVKFHGMPHSRNLENSRGFNFADGLFSDF